MAKYIRPIIASSVLHSDNYNDNLGPGSLAKFIQSIIPTIVLHRDMPC